jgi:O-antigen/teichoic acid export membrane protein
MNTNARTTNSMKNIFSGFVGQLIQTILGFISRTIFIKYLGAEYLGVSGLFSNILGLLSLAELGVGSAITFSLYKPIADNNKTKIAALMNLYGKAYNAIGIFIGIVGITFIPFIDDIIKNTLNIQESIYIIYLFYLFNSVSSYFFSYKISIINADQRNYIVQAISYVISIIQTIFQVIILITTKNFLLYLILQSVFNFLNNFLISRTANKLYPFIRDKNAEKLDKETKKGIINNIRALTITKLGGTMVGSTDNIIISYFSGIVSIGLCSNYNLLISIINGILQQLFSSISASIGNLNAKEEVEKKISFFYILNFMNFWLFGFGTIGIIILSNDIIRLWLGSSYILPQHITIIMAVNFYMVGMQNAVWTYKSTLGLFKYGRYMVFATGIINIIFSIILGKIFGIFGVLAATAISRVLTNSWYEPYAVFKYGFDISPKTYFLKYLKYIVILIFILIVTDKICSYIIVANLGGFLLKGVICSLIPNFAIITLFYKTSEFKYIKSLAYINKLSILKLKYDKITMNNR